MIIDNPPGSELVTVSLRNDDPQGLPEVVNAVVDTYNQEIVAKAGPTSWCAAINLDKKFRAYKSNVLEKERQLYELNQQIGTTDAETAKVRMRIEVADLEGLMQSRAEAQRQIGELSMKIALLKAMLAGAEKGQVPEDKIEDAITHDPQILQANNELSTPCSARSGKSEKS